MTALEFLYFCGLSVKKHYSVRRRKQLPRKVVSIGNLTLGGTGKTPAAMAIAKEAINRGFKPCILTRGYRGEAGPPCFVGKGEGALLSADKAGDEAVLMSERLSGVPVIKGKDRYQAGLFALRELPPTLNPDFFILDDGFQHWRLWRDKDILLIDAAKPFGNGRTLPLGSLREPLSAMDRADVIVITKKDQTGKRNTRRMNSGAEKSLADKIRVYNKKAPLFFAEHKPTGFVTAKGERLPLEWAKGKRFFGFCGIGSPQSFIGTLTSAGLEVTGFKPYRDHHKYSVKDIRMIKAEAKDAGWIVTTEKDIMRLKGFELPENLTALVIEFYTEKRFYDEVFEVLNNC